MKFKKALVMGTGRLPFQCALRLGGVFDQADICVLETKLAGVSVLEKLCMNHQISYACLSKTQIEERLRGISEPTLVVSAVNTYLFQPWFLQQEHITTINYITRCSQGTGGGMRSPGQYLMGTRKPASHGISWMRAWTQGG